MGRKDEVMKKWTEIEGQFTESEGDDLQELSKNKVVLEIGSWYGRSTVCLAEVAQQVYACDPHKAANTQILGEKFVSLDNFKENIQGYNNIVLLLGKSEDMVPSLGNRFFDVVWIDGCHNYSAVKMDIEVALPKLKDKGIMVFHDWGWDGNKDGGPSKAVKEIFGEPELIQCGKLAIVRKEQCQQF